MSGGQACRCDRGDRDVQVVTRRKSRCSAFDGYHVKPSAYSEVFCTVCHAIWRTKAKYIENMADGTLRTEPDDARELNRVHRERLAKPITDLPASTGGGLRRGSREPVRGFH